jgi:hypothetical protein
MGGLILEGVTGAGKTRVLDALLADPRTRGLLGTGRVWREEETFGPLMDEVKDPSMTDVRRCARLRRVMQALARGSLDRGEAFGFLLERFHPSYYALMPNWRLYAQVDEALGRLGGRLALLTYPSDQAAGRALAPRPGDEVDREAGLSAYFGSREKAVEAVLASQARRLELLERTSLPFLVIDTAARDWAFYARQAIEFWRGNRESAAP